VIKEIENLIDEYGIRGIWFLDDTFTVNKKWVIESCNEIRNNNIDIIWGCQARVDTVSEELLKEMKASGCVQVDFGLESGSDNVLRILKKYNFWSDSRSIGLDQKSRFAKNGYRHDRESWGNPR
jgi:radical SAM superfamily enzyme YgiQ (UPF0313 family)